MPAPCRCTGTQQMHQQRFFPATAEIRDTQNTIFCTVAEESTCCERTPRWNSLLLPLC